MATVLTHAIAAAAIGSVFPPTLLRRTLWLAGAACAILPDFDVLGFAFGVRYADVLGHRGLSHSLLFALVVAVVATFVVFHRRRPAWIICLYLFLATASHGLLDALTDGGLGIAFFSPFDTTRYFFPVQPIHVSPIGVGFFSAAAIPVLLSEALWIWLPCAVVIAASVGMQRRTAHAAAAAVQHDPNPK
ncbi:MAG: metal-dependent hydrolase [Planctomycetes bacterium]|nr:metal-dependent hydrolase [Planctomycetota bacterium]